MIRRPDAEDLSGNAAIEAARDMGEGLDRATRPLRDRLVDAGRLFLWAQVIPLVAIPAHYLLSERWPEIFGNVFVWYGLIGLWFWLMWRSWQGPRLERRLRERNLGDPFAVEAALLRAQLETQWTERKRFR